MAGASEEELTHTIKALVGNREVLTREGLKESLAEGSDPTTRVIIFNRAQRIREELQNRGAEDPRDYLPDLREYLDFFGFE